MHIRFGVAPIAWTNSDLPQLGGDTTLETCLTQTKEAGFSGTETGVKFPMDAAQLGPIGQWLPPFHQDSSRHPSRSRQR